MGQKIPESKKLENNNILKIDIIPAYQKRSRYPLSKVAESIKYIPLKTSSDYILDDYLKKIIITKKEIFVSVFGDCVYRFSINGEFLNKIGKIGRGPEECIKPKDMILDSANHQVIILDEDKLVSYGFDGSFIKKWPLGFSSGNLIQLDANTILLNDLDYLFKKPGDRFSFKFYTLKNNQVISKVACDKEDKIPFSICTPIMYAFNHQSYLKDYWSDTIYQIIDPYTLKAYAVVETGKFNYRDSDDKAILTGASSSDDTWIIDIVNISETNRFIFIVSNKGLFYYDKVQKETFCCNFKIEDNDATLFANDLTKGPDLSSFIYNYAIDNNSQVSYKTALSFFEKGSRRLKPGLDRSLNDLHSDDNQVLELINYKPK
jgi:hypothetical protein